MSNWEKLQQKLTATAAASNKKRKFDNKKGTPHSSSVGTKGNDVSKKGAKTNDNESIMSTLDAKAAKIPEHIRTKYVGLDCEMVGIGPSGKCSVLARCCLTSLTGDVLYDEFVRPSDFVTDFRTEYSGVRKRDLRTAISLAQCQQDVARQLKGKILVGHALHNDLKVLLLSHPHTHIRDTARYKFYMRPHGKKGGKFKPRALRDLTKQHLKMTIQQGEHDPSIDARCAMNLYRLQMSEWESSLRLKRSGKAVLNTIPTSSQQQEEVGGEEETSSSSSDNGENSGDNDSEDDGDDIPDASTPAGDFVRAKKPKK